MEMSHLRRREYEESLQHPVGESSTASSLATEPTSDMNRPPAVDNSKKAFKRLCRMYMRLQRPPPTKDMETIWKFKNHIDFEDFVLWKEQVGIKRGVMFDEDGTIIFEEWPRAPHDEIIDEFNSQFDRQFKSFFANTPHYPLWINHGTTGSSPSF
jgi:hypothetical protein